MKGFTLVELLVTIAIVAILTSVAVPSYVGYVERSKLISGTEELSGLRGRMEQHYQRDRTYLDGTACGISNFTGEYFANTCTATKTTYKWEAKSQAGHGLGDTGDYVYTVDQDNKQETEKFAGSTPTETAGWKIRK